jgi:hypothetical protein
MHLICVHNQSHSWTSPPHLFYFPRVYSATILRFLHMIPHYQLLVEDVLNKGLLHWTQKGYKQTNKQTIINNSVGYLVGVRGPFLTSPLAPRGEIVPQGWNLSPRGEVPPFVPPRGEHSFIVWKNGGANREFHLQGITSPLGDKFTPAGQLRPWGLKLAPRGEVKNGPLGLNPDIKQTATPGVLTLSCVSTE